MTTAIYARYSCDRQRETSIEDQVRRCREMAARLGLDEASIEVYADEALSGTARHTARRSGLQRLLADWDSGRIEVILAEEMSRLSRDAVDTAQLQRRVEETGVRLVTLNGVDSSSQNWQLSAGVQAIVAQQAIRDTSIRVPRGMQGQLERGYMIAAPPYGYRLDRHFDALGERVGTLWVIHPEHADIVREIYAARASGQSFGQIATCLNERGLVSPRPGRNRKGVWRNTTIRRMLGNPIYKGKFVWHGSTTYKWQQKKKKRPVEETVYDRPELRLVSDELWDRCNESRVSRTGYGGGRNELSGLVRCGRCGATCSVKHNGNSPSLSCGSCAVAQQSGLLAQTPGSVAVTGVRVLLTETINILFAEPFVTEFRARLRERMTASVDDELARASLERDRLKRSCERLVDLLASEQDSDDYLDQRYKKLRDQYKQAEAYVDDIKRRAAKVDRKAIEEQLQVDPRDLLRRIWDSGLPPERIRATLVRLFDEVTFLGKAARFTSIFRVRFAPGVIAAVASGSEPVDRECTEWLFALSCGRRRPTMWTVERISEIPSELDDVGSGMRHRR